ncbi:MAG: T9SS type A sorting domain-containing protein, partial [Saprospiraceae bacterium]
NYSSNARYSWKITGGSVSKYSLDSLQVKIKWKNGATDRKVKLLVSDFCGKDSTTVNVISTLPATIKSNSPVCTGLILLLEANGGINYIWEGPNGFTWEEKNVKIGNMSTMEAGIYTVTVSATSGCSAVVKTTVVVAPLPSTVKSNSPVCLGNTLQLNAVGGTIYQWSGPNNFSSNLQSPEIKNCTQAQNGTYTVTVSDASGCSAVLETKVEIAAQINPIVSANLPVCTGNVLKLKASGGTFYKWEGPNGFKSDLQNPEISNVAMIQSGTYTVTVSNTNGCSGKGQTIVNVLDVSGIMAVVKNNGPVCVGDTVKLTVSGGASYKWSGPAGFSSTNDKINILNAAKNLEGSYVVTVTGSNGCSVTTQTSVKINALPLAVATCNSPVCIGSDVNFLGQGGLSYLWTGPANFESTLQNPTLTKVNLNNSGTYSVVVTDANKCKNTATVKLEVKTCISTKDGQSNSQIKVFPNPAKDRLNISATSIMKWVEISNIAGQKIMERALNSSETVLDVSELIDGDYFLKVYLSDKNFEVFKIIIKD